MVVYNTGFEMAVFVCDADMIRDLMTKKNTLIDKTMQTVHFFGALMGEAFLITPGGPLWKAKRQATAHAFYKDRL